MRPMKLTLLLVMLTAGFALPVLSGCDHLSFPGLERKSGERPAVELKLPKPPPSISADPDVRVGLLYYPDEQWRFLVPVYRSIPWEETIIRVTLGRLIASPDRESELNIWGLSPVLPRGVEINGIAINDGLARVDFNAAFLDYPAERERLVLSSLLCTIQQFEEVDRLEIMIEGDKVEQFPGGTPGRLPFGPEYWINPDVDDELEDYTSFSPLKLYFCYCTPDGYIFYVPVTRIKPPVEDNLWATVEELLDGPPAGSGLFSDLPDGITLRSLIMEDELVTVDLSSELLNYRGGRTGAENLVNQLLLTLGAAPGVREIQILVEGETVILESDLDLSAPLKPPAIYNYF